MHSSKMSSARKQKQKTYFIYPLLKSPLVFPPDLLFFWSKMILDVERFVNLLWIKHWDEDEGTSGLTPCNDERMMSTTQLDREAIEDEEEHIFTKLKQLAFEREKSNLEESIDVFGVCGTNNKTCALGKDLVYLVPLADELGEINLCWNFMKAYTFKKGNHNKLDVVMKCMCGVKVRRLIVNTNVEIARSFTGEPSKSKKQPQKNVAMVAWSTLQERAGYRSWKKFRRGMTQ
ncbi:hypothetical protein IFM89_009028 [Coptis chinensis]|uniref:Uncharacterized protein n=1 Tax=Coptis chinensis TaxID=261450 RepID=A0A835LIS3_9MAGN|nr:hypothetical protein IFM89_009028 [Coptis chinensis]